MPQPKGNVRQIKHNDTWQHGAISGIMEACPDCRNIKRLHASFQEFGYSTLRLIDMEEAYKKAFEVKNKAEASATGDIIVIMTYSQLVEAGMIKDEE